MATGRASTADKIPMAEDFGGGEEADERSVSQLRSSRGKDKGKPARKRMAAREKVPIIPRIDRDANATWAWYLRPDGFLPAEAIVFKPASSATTREDYEAKGFILLSRMTGEYGRGTLETAPPSRELCEELAEELMSRRPDYLEWVDQQIEQQEELAEAGKPEWRRTYLMKSRQLNAIREVCKDLEITGEQLYAFFVQVHAAQVQNRLPAWYRQMTEQAAEEAAWTNLARETAGALFGL